MEMGVAAATAFARMVIGVIFRDGDKYCIMTILLLILLIVIAMFRTLLSLVSYAIQGFGRPCQRIC